MAEGLDIFVAGFPKCGTTSMRALMESHDEINVLHKYQTLDNGKIGEIEYYLKLGNNFFVDDLIQDIKEHGIEGKKNAIKWPEGIINDGVESISELENYNPEDHVTKIIIGMRHPVQWFESFYNFRVLLNADEVFPDPYSLVGGVEQRWRGVYTDLARWDLSLMQLGKWSLSQKDMQVMVSNNLETIATPYPVFLYDVDQLTDPDDDRNAAFRQDLSDFLDLKETFERIPHSNDHHDANPDGKIDICDNLYNDLRTHLVNHGKITADWLTSNRGKGLDVTIGGEDYFYDLIQGWGKDPCEVTLL